MLETSRLKLVPLSHQQLLLYKNDYRGLTHDLAVKYQEPENDPSIAQDLSEAIGFWITNTQRYPEQYKWVTNWMIILKTDSVIIGGIGFAGVPDSEGKSMVGYGLDTRYHGHGFATEALKAILDWGFSNGLRTALADTPITHVGSQRVLIKNGFNEHGRDDTLIHWKCER